MNSQQNQNNSSSIIIDLETLQKEYSNLLKSYQAAVAEYITYLNQPSSESSLVAIKGVAYNGTGSAGSSDASTLQQCTASCYASKSCTGATFVSNKCLIRIGDSPIIPSSDNSYAIIPKAKQLLQNMESINEQLINVNNQLLEKTKSADPVYYKTDHETSLKNNELLKSYEKLLEERKIIEKTLNDYENLEQSENENNIKLTQNYYSYILLVIFSLIIIVVLYLFSGSKNNSQQNIQYGGDVNRNGYFIIFGLLIVIVLVKIFYKY
jgi:hypothetical protein